MIDPALAWIRKHSAFARKLEARDDPLAALPMSTPQTHPDRAGRDRRLRQGRYPNCARAGRARHRVCRRRAESRLVEKLREDGVAAVPGDAIEPIVLVQAHIARAGMLVVTLPDVFDVRQIVEISRTLNPALEVVLCTNSGDERRAAVERGDRHRVHGRDRTRARDDRARARQDDEAGRRGFALTARGSVPRTGRARRPGRPRREKWWVAAGTLK